MHESDCECSLVRLTGVAAGVAGGSVGKGARRRPGAERACRRRRTHAQHERRERRRYSELRYSEFREFRWNRVERYRYDGYRSSDDEMDAERGKFVSPERGGGGLRDRGRAEDGQLADIPSSQWPWLVC